MNRALVAAAGHYEVFDARRAEARRISPGDTVRLALVHAPDDRHDVSVFLEIWEPGGAQPDNSHPASVETFFFLAGEGVAHCDGANTPVSAGQLLVLHATSRHRIENTGPGRLYAITTMAPDAGFAAMVTRGVPAPLDASDLAVLESWRSPADE